MKLAILDADILREDLIDSHKSYGRMFRDLFAETAPHWHTEVFNVVNGHYPRHADFDAILITGSQHDAFSDLPWIVRLRKFCRDCYQQEKPLLGICFGHQLLAHALGGKAERSDKGWGLGIMNWQQLEQPAFVDQGESVSLLVSHQDQVSELPPGARLLLASDFCLNAAFYIPGKVLCFQGHPEFNRQYFLDLIAGRRERFPPAAYDAAVRSTQGNHERERVARWIVRFTEEAVAQRR